MVLGRLIVDRGQQSDPPPPPDGWLRRSELPACGDGRRS